MNSYCFKLSYYNANKLSIAWSRWKACVAKANNNYGVRINYLSRLLVEYATFKL